MQRVHHRRDRQGGRPVSGSRGQQLLGGQAQVAGLADQGGDLRGAGAGGGGHRADGELLGQAKVDPGELGRDQALAQVADHRQQAVRGPGQQHRQPVHQGQPAAGPLQVTVGRRDGQVLHGSLLQPIMTRRVPEAANRSGAAAGGTSAVDGEQKASTTLGTFG